MDCVLACADVELGVHAKQVLDVVAAGVPEYVALPQFEHAAEPVAVLYWPARHAAQANPFRPVYPALHVHAVIAVAPTGELANVFVGQSVHVELAEAPNDADHVPSRQSVQKAGPDAILYFPAKQFTHVPPFGPVDPALQVQPTKAEAPAPEFEFVGHALHVDSANAPTAVEYLPAPQSVH